jgi:hypothetical protein
VIEAGVAAGQFRVEDPARTTLRLTCLMDGLAVQAVLGGAGLTPDGLAREWLTGVAQELGLDPAELVGRAEVAALSHDA